MLVCTSQWPACSPLGSSDSHHLAVRGHGDRSFLSSRLSLLWCLNWATRLSVIVPCVLTFVYFSPPQFLQMCFSSIRCGRDIMNIQGKDSLWPQLSNCFNSASSKVNMTFIEASQGSWSWQVGTQGSTSPGLCTCCLSLCHLSDWGRTVLSPHFKGYKTSTERQINLLQITHRSCYIKDVRFMSR